MGDNAASKLLIPAPKKRVEFHGALAEDFLPEWECYADTPFDVLKLLEANRPGLARHWMLNGYFILYLDDKPVDGEAMYASFDEDVTLHFVPVVAGALLTTVIYWIVAIIAVVGLAMAFGSMPDADDVGTEQNAFQSAVNVTAEGTMLPVWYGETRGGSVVISAERSKERAVASAIRYVDDAGTFSWLADLGIDFEVGYPQGGDALVTRALHALSEGPIEGLVSGPKSVLFNDTQLLADDDTANFERVRYEFRDGDDPNTLLSLIQDSASERSPAVNTKLDTSRTIITLATDTDAARILLRTPALFRQRSDGDRQATFFDITIEKRTSGGSWVEVVVSEIRGLYTSEAFFEVLVELDNATQWDIAVKRNTAESTSSKINNILFWDNVVEIVRDRVRYDGTALVGLEYDNYSFGGRNPKTEFIAKGRKVRIPSNYNPVTRAYTGVWNGSYVEDYTNNIAFCIQDVIENTNFGLGDWLEGKFDTNKVYTMGQLADGSVDDGKGGTEPRYTLNYRLTERKRAMEILRDLSSVMRSTAIWDGQQVTFFADEQTRTVAKVVTQANVLDGDFTYTYPSTESRVNSAVVTFLDEDNNYLESYVRYRDHDQVRKYGLNEREFKGFSTSRGQALRQARFTVANAEGAVISFDGIDDCAGILPGELIAVYNPVKMGREQSGRVAAGATTTNIPLDRDFEIESGKTYTMECTLPDGTVEQQSITNAMGTYSSLTVGTAFTTAPQEESVWGIIASDLSPDFYIVQERQHRGAGVYRITALQYFSSRFAFVETGIDVDDTTPTTLPNPDAITAPSNIQFQVDRYVDETGAPQVDLLIAWDPPTGRTDTLGYTVQYEWNDNPTVDHGSVNGPYARIARTQEGDYVIYIRAHAENSVSPFVSATYTLTADPGETITRVTGLELDGQGNVTVFTGQNPKFVWRRTTTFDTFGDAQLSLEDDDLRGADHMASDPFFKDYIVRMLDSSGNELRNELVVVPEYTYSLERNIEDGGPRRAITIEVTHRDVFNNLSAPVQLPVSNPQEAQVTPVINVGIGTLHVGYVKPDGTDWAGTKVYVDVSSGFTPGPGNEVVDSPGTNFTIEQAQGATRYVVVAAYDAFDKLNLNYSTEVEVTTLSVAGVYSIASVTDPIIRNGMGAAILEARDDSNTLLTAGTVKLYIDGVEVTAANGYDANNLVEYSETGVGGDGNWTSPLRVNVAESSTERGPFGRFAQSLSEDNSLAATHYCQMNGNIPLAASQNHRVTGFFKASNRDWVKIRVEDLGGVADTVNFNILTGEIGTTTGAPASINVIPVPGMTGWFACGFNFGAGTGAEGNTQIRIQLLDDVEATSFDGLSQESILYGGVMITTGASRQPYVYTNAVKHISDGYTAVLGADDIQGSVVVALSDGGGNAPFDQQTVIDVLDNPGITVSLSDDNYSVTANNDGTGYDVSAFSGSMYVFEYDAGLRDLTGHGRVGYTVVGGSGDPHELTKNGLTLSIADTGIFTLSAPADSWTSDLESFTLRATVDIIQSRIGNVIDLVSESFDLEFTITKAKAGADATAPSIYYIKPTAGTAIKNGAGQLTVEARQIVLGVDTLISSGTVKLYDPGNNELTLANGYVTGSDGYTGILDAGDIAGSKVITMKDGTGGTPLDTITLADITDGDSGMTGFITPDFLAWSKGANDGDWVPAATFTDLVGEFWLAGAQVATETWRVTRDSAGLLTTAIEGSSDANVTVSVTGASSASSTLEFEYDDGTDNFTMAETVISVVGGAGVIPNQLAAPLGAGKSYWSMANLTTADMGSFNGTLSFSSDAFKGAQAAQMVGASSEDVIFIAQDATDYNLSLEAGRRWVVAAQFEVNSLTNADFRARLKGQDATNYYNGDGAKDVASANVYERIGFEIDLTSGGGSTETLFLLAIGRQHATDDTWRLDSVGIYDCTDFPQYDGDTPPPDVPPQAGSDGSDGTDGGDGISPTVYYIRALNGNAIKNSTGTLTYEARQIVAGVDSLISTGGIQLYDPSNDVVTVANGYASGSDGYTGVLDAGDISDSKILYLKDGVGGTTLDTVTAADITDGANGSDAVTGFLTIDPAIAWTRAKHEGAWAPADSTASVIVEFWKAGSKVGEEEWEVTLNTSNGNLSALIDTGTLPDDGNITVNTSGGGTAALTLEFVYVNGADTFTVAETWVSSQGGDQGDQGISPTVYYIKPLAGNVIKNSVGNLTYEAHQIVAGVDSLISSGTIRLYDPSNNILNVASGYVTGSDGYTGILDDGDIAGSKVITLKDGTGGTPLDTVTAADITDGVDGDPGGDAITGWVEADFLAWTQAKHGGAWSPATSVVDLVSYFYLLGVEVGTETWRVTRDASGDMTAALQGANDGNISVVVRNPSSPNITVEFAYDDGTHEFTVVETVNTSQGGEQGDTGPAGSAGASGDPGDLGIPGAGHTLLYDNVETTQPNAAGRYAILSDYTDVTSGILSDADLQTADGVCLYAEDRDGDNQSWYLSHLTVGSTITLKVAEDKWYSYRVASVITDGAAAPDRWVYQVTFEEKRGDTAALDGASGVDVDFRFSVGYPEYPSFANHFQAPYADFEDVSMSQIGYFNTANILKDDATSKFGDFCIFFDGDGGGYNLLHLGPNVAHPNHQLLPNRRWLVGGWFRSSAAGMNMRARLREADATNHYSGVDMDVATTNTWEQLWFDIDLRSEGETDYAFTWEKRQNQNANWRNDGNVLLDVTDYPGLTYKSPPPVVFIPGGQPQLPTLESAPDLTFGGGITNINMVLNATVAQPNQGDDPGEVYLGAGQYMLPDGTVRRLVSAVDAYSPWDGRMPTQGAAFLVWGASDASSRFTSLSSWGSSEADGIFFCTHDPGSGQYFAHSNNSWIGEVFTPAATDIVIATCYKRSEATSGFDGMRAHIPYSPTTVTLAPEGFVEDFSDGNLLRVQSTWEHVPSNPGPAEQEVSAQTNPVGTYVWDIGHSNGNDEFWAVVSQTLAVPVIDGELYEMKIIWRQHKDSGLDRSFFAGVQAWKGDVRSGNGQEINTTGGNGFAGHWFAANSVEAPNTDWNTDIGYFQLGTGNGDFKAGVTSPIDPGFVDQDTEYASPAFLGNYQGEQGEVDIAYVHLKRVGNVGGQLGDNIYDESGNLVDDYGVLNEHSIDQGINGINANPGFGIVDPARELPANWWHCNNGTDAAYIAGGKTMNLEAGQVLAGAVIAVTGGQQFSIRARVEGHIAPHECRPLCVYKSSDLAAGTYALSNSTSHTPNESEIDLNGSLATHLVNTPFEVGTSFEEIEEIVTIPEGAKWASFSIWNGESTASRRLEVEWVSVQHLDPLTFAGGGQASWISITNSPATVSDYSPAQATITIPMEWRRGNVVVASVDVVFTLAPAGGTVTVSYTNETPSSSISKAVVGGAGGTAFLQVELTHDDTGVKGQALASILDGYDDGGGFGK